MSHTSLSEQAKANSVTAGLFLCTMSLNSLGLPYWGSMARTVGHGPESDLGQVKAIKCWVAGNMGWGATSRTAKILATALPLPQLLCEYCSEPLPYRSQAPCECQLVPCEHCSDAVDPDSMVSVNVSWRGTELWCEPCADYHSDHCEGCCEYASHSYGYSRSCNECGNTRCESCSDDWAYCDSCEESYCGYCSCDCSESPEGVHPYGWCPPLVTHGGQGATFGFELEVGCGTEAVEATCEAFPDYLWWTEDCSVPQGAELTTHPATWGHIRQTLPSLMATLRESGAWVPNVEGHGLHVHIGRAEAGLTGEVLEAFVHLIYANHTQWRAVARRDGSQWAPFDRAALAQPSSKLTNGEFGGYREAVNLVPSRTVEIRLGGATTDTDEIMAWVGLLAAAVEYSKAKAGDLGAMGWDEFMGWVFTSEFGPDILPTVYRLTVAA